MSMNQTDPFQATPTNPEYAEAPPQKSSNRGCLIGCGVAALVGLLICCGGVAYFAVRGPAFLANVVNEAMGAQIRQQLATEPSIQQRIGEIQSLEFDMTQTVENAQQASEAGEEPKMVFRIVGSNGSGIVLIEHDPAGPDGAGIKSGTLVMDDGTEYPLDIEAIKAAAPSDLPIDLDATIDDGQLESLEIGPIDIEDAIQSSQGEDNNGVDPFAPGLSEDR